MASKIFLHDSTSTSSPYFNKLKTTVSRGRKQTKHMHTLDCSLLYHAAACLWSRLRETSAVYIIAWIIKYESSLFLRAGLVSFIRDNLGLKRWTKRDRVCR